MWGKGTPSIYCSKTSKGVHLKQYLTLCFQLFFAGFSSFARGCFHEWKQFGILLSWGSASLLNCIDSISRSSGLKTSVVSNTCLWPIYTLSVMLVMPWQLEMKIQNHCREVERLNYHMAKPTIQCCCYVTHNTWQEMWTGMWQVLLQTHYQRGDQLLDRFYLRIAAPSRWVPIYLGNMAPHTKSSPYESIRHTLG